MAYILFGTLVSFGAGHAHRYPLYLVLPSERVGLNFGVASKFPLL